MNDRTVLEVCIGVNVYACNMLHRHSISITTFLYMKNNNFLNCKKGEYE